MLNDVNIKKVKTGLNRPAPNTDGISLIVAGGISIVSGGNTLVQYNTPYLGYGVSDFTALGITAAYDTNNNIKLYKHIYNFYKKSPGQPLWIYLVSQSTPQHVMWDNTSSVGVQDALDKALTAQPIMGVIKLVSTVLNPLVGYTPTITTNIDNDVLLAIPKAQALANAMTAAKNPIDCIIEGRNFGTDAGVMLDLRTFDMENVNLCINQDLAVSGSAAIHNGYADVGTYLGTASSKYYSTATGPDLSIANSPAEVGLNYEGNIQDATDGTYVTYGMGNQPLASLNPNANQTGVWSLTDQGTIELYGYVAPRIFSSTPGVYFNQSTTCAAATSDFTRLQISRVWNKALRLIYAAYVPYINKKFKLSPAGGLPGDTLKMLENVGNEVFATMVANGEISAGATVIPTTNPDGSPIVYANNPVIAPVWNIQPYGYSESIEGTLEFTITISGN